jgi:putative transposase
VDLAFDAFFRRVKAGGKPGYPRFKSIRRFAGWGYKTHGDGWRLNLKPDKHGAVHLSGIGTVRMRGKGRFTGKPKTAEVVRRRGKWYLSVTFNVEADSLVPLAGARWETTNRYDKTGFIGLLRRGYPCLQT